MPQRDTTPAAAPVSESAEETPEWVAVKIERIRERVNLMRWSERLDEEPPAKGSLASVFWDSDVPWLLDHAQPKGESK